MWDTTALRCVPNNNLKVWKIIESNTFFSLYLHNLSTCVQGWKTGANMKTVVFWTFLLKVFYAFLLGSVEQLEKWGREGQ